MLFVLVVCVWGTDREIEREKKIERHVLPGLIPVETTTGTPNLVMLMSIAVNSAPTRTCRDSLLR